MTLSPLSPSALNAKSPSPSSPFNFSKVHNMATVTFNLDLPVMNEDEIHWDEEPSSPFQSQLPLEEQKRIASMETASLREESELLDIQSVSPRRTSDKINPSTPFEICEDDTASMPPPSSALVRATKRKSTSPVKSRMSVFGLSSPNKQLFTEDRMASVQESSYSFHSTHSAKTTPRLHRETTTSVHEEMIKRAKTFTTSITTGNGNTDSLMDVTFATAELENESLMDDTCFSTFSEVPNMDMTNFAQLGKRSPTKTTHLLDQTPRGAFYGSRDTPNTLRTVASSRSPSPTPRANDRTDNDTTNLLLDFTQQFEAVSTLSNKLRAISRRSMSPSKDNSINPSTEPHLLSYLNSQRSPRKTNAGGLPSTPSSKNLLTLLDFELPPAPTPRSVPTISVRELESLKSNYASQISALKATLSGREAEVEALKRAVGDAERRVGEATEELREQRGRRECAEREKEEWENRGAEFEDVLKRVKKEVLEGEREREEVLSRAEDAEERVRELEARLADSEERVRKAESAKTDKTSVSSVADSDSRGPLFTAEQVQRQIDEKVHALSTELHAIYKKKHVTKVAGLKKGFEAKTKEKTMELSAQIDKLERQNDDLQAKLDGTLSGVVPGLVGLDGISNEQRDAELKKLEEQKTIIERQKAELAGREEELKAQRAEYSIVMNELERERVEKGELVAAVDEMLALQSDMSVVHAAASEPSTAPIVEEALRKSIGLGAPRASGLAKPGFGFGSRLAKPTIGKSRMMSQIEKMGGGGRSAE